MNAAGEADFMQIGGDYTFFDEREGDYRTTIGNLLVENVTVSSDFPTGGIVVRSCEIDNMTVKNANAEVENLNGTIKNLKVKQ